MVIFNDCKPSIKEEDIEIIEKKYSIDFPADYKKHILKFNGGNTKPDVFTFIEKGKSTNSRIDLFYAIGSGSYDDLEDIIETFKTDNKRMPTPIIPIAEDAFGNIICISNAKADYGYIYFWDHENEVDYSKVDDTDYSNLYIIAKSLQALFDGLFELK